MYQVDPARLDLVHEFRSAPLGPYSRELQDLVLALRMGPIKGKFVLLADASGSTWELAQLTGRRYDPPQRLGEVFADLRHAEWVQFRRRWESRTGHTLEIQ